MFHTPMMKQKHAHAQAQAPLKIIALSDESVDPLRQLACLPSGGIFIFRHYHTPDRARLAGDLLSQARAQRRNLRFLIAGDAQLAYQLAADGLHYPEWLIRRERRVRRLKPHWLISAAAHSWVALRQAALAGADFALLSPVFEIQKNPKKTINLKPLGLCRLARSVALAQEINLPICALGGIIRPQTARRLRASGVAGWGSVRAFALNAFWD